MKLPLRTPVFLRIVLFFMLVSTGLHAQTYRAVLFNGSGINTYDRITAMTIAGIVNRDSARLYLMNVYETWSYNQTDETWRDIYKSRGSVVFDSIYTIGDLINRFRPFINGAVVYDLYRTYSNFSGQSFNYQAEVAAVIGALSNRIPVHAAYATAFGLQVSDSLLINDTFDGDSAVYVTGRLDKATHPWNNTTLTEEARFLRLLDYGIAQLLPRCNPSKFYIRELTDFTVQQKMFQMNVAGTDDLDFASLSTAKADKLEYVLQYLHAKNPNNIFHIFGWMRPEPMTQWFAQFGSSFHETLLSNLSWHASFPVQRAPLTLKSAVQADTVQLRNSYYLLFVGTEGDAANWNFGLQAGAWQSAFRGNVPVAWGWNLYLLDLCPFVATYYYETATKNDGFISVTSPLGYAYPDLWGSDVREDAVTQSRQLMNRFSVNEVYAYKHYAGSGTMVYRGKTINNSFNFSKLGAFQRDINAAITFLFDPQLGTQTPNTAFGSLLFNHVGDGTFYGDASSIPNMGARIVNLLKNKPKPYFLLAGYQRFRQDNFAGRSDPSSVDINMERLMQLQTWLKADTGMGKDITLITPQYFSVLLRKKLNLPVDVETDETEQPVTMQLAGYPNPFNATTIIRYGLPKAAKVQVEIFDIMGNAVAELVNTEQSAGVHEVRFSGSALSSGMYFCRLQVGSSAKVIKLLLLK